LQLGTKLKPSEVTTGTATTIGGAKGPCPPKFLENSHFVPWSAVFPNTIVLFA